MEKYNREFKKDCPSASVIPTIIKDVHRIIAIGDIHGDINMTLRILLSKELSIVRINEKFIKKLHKMYNTTFDKLDFRKITDKNLKIVIDAMEWIGGSTHVVQVGDQVDRCRPINGKECHEKGVTFNDEQSDVKIMKIFTELDKKAEKHKGRVISLLGNHEIMNVIGDLRYVSYEGLMQFCDRHNDDIDTCMDKRHDAFKPGGIYSELLGCNRISAVVIGSNLFVHAGIITKFIENMKNNGLHIKDVNDIHMINEYMRKWLLGKIDNKMVKKIYSSSKSIFWNRIFGNIPPDNNNESFYPDDCKDEVENILKLFKIGSIIIGHTPQQHGIKSACKKKVWKIDTGSSKSFYYFKSMKENNPQVLEIINDKKFNVIQIS